MSKSNILDDEIIGTLNQYIVIQAIKCIKKRLMNDYKHSLNLKNLAYC